MYDRSSRPALAARHTDINEICSQLTAEHFQDIQDSLKESIHTVSSLRFSINRSTCEFENKHKVIFHPKQKS